MDGYYEVINMYVSEIVYWIQCETEVCKWNCIL